MQEAVHVFLKGTQWEGKEGGGDPLNLSVTRTEGICRRLSGVWHILFREEEEGRERKTHIVLRQELMEVHTRGDVSVDFLFVKGEQTSSVYKTGYGDIPMQIFTRELKICEGEEELSADLAYELGTGGGPALFNRIELWIRP